MDQALLDFFNSYNGRFEILDAVLQFAALQHIKAAPFMMVVWSLWFLPKSEDARTAIRERLIAVLLCCVPIIMITRLLANSLPFRPRPIHTDGLELRFHEGQNLGLLDGWSSMPSDHASLFLGLAVAIFFIHRGFGLFLLAWAIFVVSIPRIILGLHWPSDIVGGAGIGIALAAILLGPLTRLVRASRIVPFFEAKEAIGYPLLFLATYEVTQMFQLTRYLINAAGG